jgi:hypothetical protein
LNKAGVRCKEITYVRISLNGQVEEEQAFEKFQDIPLLYPADIETYPYRMPEVLRFALFEISSLNLKYFKLSQSVIEETLEEAENCIFIH